MPSLPHTPTQATSTTMTKGRLPYVLHLQHLMLPGESNVLFKKSTMPMMVPMAKGKEFEVGEEGKEEEWVEIIKGREEVIKIMEEEIEYVCF